MPMFPLQLVERRLFFMIYENHFVKPFSRGVKGIEHSDGVVELGHTDFNSVRERWDHRFTLNKRSYHPMSMTDEESNVKYYQYSSKLESMKVFSPGLQYVTRSFPVI